MPDRPQRPDGPPPEGLLHHEEHFGGISEAIAEVADETDERDPTPLGWLVWVYDHLAGLVVAVLLVAVTYAVFARAFGHAILGVVELGGYALVIATLLAAAGLARRDGHVRVELVDMVVKKMSVLKWVEVFATAVQVIVTAVVLYASIRLTLADISQDRQLSYGNEYLPRQYVSMFLPIGLGGLLLVLLDRLVKGIREPVQEREDD